MKKHTSEPQRPLGRTLAEGSMPSLGNADLPGIRKQIVDVVAREALGMVGGSVDAAKDGQYGAMKCLFELVGLFPAPVESVADPGEGLVEKLLRQLEIDEAPDLANAPKINHEALAKPRRRIP